MQHLLALLGACLVLLVGACGGDPELPLGKLPPASRGVPASSVLRVPRAGGPAQLYRVPGLDPSAWKADDQLPPLERVIGADPEQRLVFLLDRKRNVLALDLETRHVRTSLEQVRQAAVGADGALYAIDTGRTVTQVARRTPIRFRSRLEGTPGELRGTMNGILLARIGGKRPALELLGSEQAPASFPIADGAMTTTLWGDLVAVAADTAVVLYETQGKRGSRTIRVSGGARAALFSPSGHRIYVARDKDELLVLDRFSGDELDEIGLPNAARGLRGDPYGKWIVVRPEVGDSAWVVDAGARKYVGAVEVSWDDDLPAIAAPNTLLTRSGADLVAVDLSGEGFPETGRIQGGAGDFWLPLAWQPAQDAAAAAAADSTLPTGADSAGAGPSIYLQVSSSQNPAWAEELSQKLRAAGLPASVLPPRPGDEAHRVVLGPYATREQAEETGRKIGMPSFIVTPEDSPDR